MLTRTRVTAIALSIAAVASLLLMVTPAAAAGCSGTRIEHIPINISGKGTVAHLDVYWNGTSGYNCARTVTTSNYSGYATYLRVYISDCIQTSGWTCTTATDFGEDAGNYQVYAGPVGVYAPGTCIYAEGEARVTGSSTIGKVKMPVSHCG